MDGKTYDFVQIISNNDWGLVKIVPINNNITPLIEIDKTVKSNKIIHKIDESIKIPFTLSSKNSKSANFIKRDNKI